MTIASLPEAESFPAGLSPQSLLGKYLTPQVWQSLKHVTTPSGVRLWDCIRSGLVHRDSVIGVYAGDEDSVEQFELLFAPLIQELHACSPAYRWSSDGPPEEGCAIPNPDPESHFIRSTRIRLVRNLRGFRLMPCISRSELVEVERRIVEAVGALESEFAGRYDALLCAKHDHGPADALVGFDGSDRFQQAAGICCDWPVGRGVFANHARSFQLWVNEEDHLRIIASQKGADIASVYTRLMQVSTSLERSLGFQRSERYGYLASCPSNLGTGMRASFHVHLPLSGGSPEFDTLCMSHGIAVRSAEGEANRQQGSVFDISNQRRLGMSSAQCIHKLLAGTAKLIALEKRYQSQGGS